MSDTYSGLMIILDGLGDRPVAELDGKTPLEAARTPNFDALAERGMTGLMDPLTPGVPVATDTGVGALMGLPAPHGLLSRGPIEAAGVGMEMGPGDVALRCNLSTVTGPPGQYQLVDRRAARISEGTSELARDLTAGLGEYRGIRATVREATSHRAVLQLAGDNLSAAISDVDPGAGWEKRGVLQARPLDPNDQAAVRTADAVNEFVERSHQILQDHPVNHLRSHAGRLPANILLPRKAGQIRSLRGIVGALGVSAAVIAGECTVAGLARLLKMTWVREPGFTGDEHTDLDAKAAAVEQALANHDLVFLHIKALDLLAHDGDPVGKQAMIEKIDAALGRLFNTDRVIAVCADHSTPCATLRHSGDPVPVILTSPGGRRDTVIGYGETPCMSGGLGRLSANGLLWSMLDQMNVTHNFKLSEIPLLG